MTEPKAIKIARVKRVLSESAMDCSLQLSANTLPIDWKKLEIEQTRSENAERVVYRLGDMLAPSFDEAGDIEACKLPIVPEDDPDHVRPLATYTDISDELLNRAAELFIQKPIWERTQLFKAMAPYSKSVVVYNLQHAITTSRNFRDSLGRGSVLESKGNLYALRPIEISNGTLVERITRSPVRGRKQLELEEKKEEEAPEKVDVAEDMLASKWNFSDVMKARFSEDILNSYVFDHALTDEERRSYLRAYPGKLKFAERLLIPGTEIYVLGHKKFDPPEEPIGEDADKLEEWNKTLVDRFLTNRDKLFGSLTMKDRKFTVSKLKVEDGKAVRLQEKSKVQGPVVCGTGIMSAGPIGTLMKQADKNGEGNTEKKRTLATNCVYTELFMREEEQDCFWLTPEELSVLFDNPRNKEKIRVELNKK
jgi:hypothetical protein